MTPTKKAQVQCLNNDGEMQMCMYRVSFQHCTTDVRRPLPLSPLDARHQVQHLTFRQPSELPDLCLVAATNITNWLTRVKFWHLATLLAHALKDFSCCRFLCCFLLFPCLACGCSIVSFVFLPSAPSALLYGIRAHAAGNLLWLSALSLFFFCIVCLGVFLCFSLL